MKALIVDRSAPRFAAARVASSWRPGAGGRVGPLAMADVDPPALPGPGWQRLAPRLSGICGSDLATVDGRSSRWFEPIVSFPFVPGHEVVGDLEDGRRVVIEPVLGCAARGVIPPCPACAAGDTRRCHQLAGGHLAPGLQTGFCADTGGGWSPAMVVHDSQIHEVPDAMADEEAVMVEPTACAVHGALAAPDVTSGPVVVIGAGTLGLCVTAALSRYRPQLSPVIVAARYPEQRRLARQLGATTAVEPAELRRAVRRAVGGWLHDDGQLSSGVPLVVDCVGSSGSLGDALAVARPGATVVMLGMPGVVSADLTPLWQREIRLEGAYTYGPEPAAGGRHSFELSFDLVGAAGLGRLVSAAYPLERYSDAIDHASAAGRRGAVKVVFDLRGGKRRTRHETARST